MRTQIDTTRRKKKQKQAISKNQILKYTQMSYAVLMCY